MIESYPTPQPASVKKRSSRLLSAVWLVPAVAAVIALYLGFRTYADRGPEITITFNTADGLVAGQTQLKYKAVSLGTVTEIELDPDTQHVDVRARMRKEASAYLTQNAHFWVVRPRINAGSISGVETLVSGAYIQCDPGKPDGKKQTRFTGLEEPPGVRSDEPGKTYTLQAEKIGSIGMGSPIYFRDVNVGEVLRYDIGDGFGPISLSIFVRSPFDGLIRPATRFWNVSGVSVNMGPGGFRVQLQSLQSLLTGGINFSTPAEAKNETPSPEKTVFPLYTNQDEAETASFHEHVPFVTYFQTSVKSLNVGSSVTMYGVRIGKVDALSLVVDPKTASMRVRVNYEIEPGRMFNESHGPLPDPLDMTRRLAGKGLRAKIVSDNLLTGQKSISLEFVPKAKSVEIVKEGDAIVMPAGPVGGIDGITDALADVAGKLDQIPLAQIGDNLNSLLTHADQTIGGPEMKNAIHSLSLTLEKAQDIVEKADKGLTPALQQLPQISSDLQQAVAHANSALAGIDQHSDFQRDAKRTMDQVNDAARSIHLLADFLNRHPEALVRGRELKEAK